MSRPLKPGPSTGVPTSGPRNGNPDIAVFAKALGNGYPMAAVIGRAEVMNMAQKTFISSTYWTDRVGPSAALATLKKHRKCKVGDHLMKMGTLVQDGWKKLGERHRIDIDVSGIPPLSHWQIKSPEEKIAHTLITKLMLEKGFLSSKAFYATYCHNEDNVKKYLNALDAVLVKVAAHIRNGTIKKMYDGPISHDGFRRLT